MYACVYVCLPFTNVENVPGPCDTGSPHLLDPANPIQSASLYFALSSSSLMACAWDGHITQHVQWPQMKAQNKNTSSDSSDPEKVSGPCGNMLFKGAFHMYRWYAICTILVVTWILWNTTTCFWPEHQKTHRTTWHTFAHPIWRATTPP